MALIVSSGLPGKPTHNRTVPLGTARAIVAAFMAEGRAIYIEPYPGDVWFLVVAPEHAPRLSELATRQPLTWRLTPAGAWVAANEAGDCAHVYRAAGMPTVTAEYWPDKSRLSFPAGQFSRAKEWCDEKARGAA
jgi:hypothetical protein